MDSAIITSVDELIERLGGPTEAGRVLGGVTAQRVWNWGAAGKLPAELYLEHRNVLSGLGIICADALWFGARVPQAAPQPEGSP